MESLYILLGIIDKKVNNIFIAVYNVNTII
jgi:hypothetical protein